LLSILKKDLRKDIQALRAIAVVIVVIFHLWPNRLPGGFVGVDVFFVISGFLITQHLLREVQSGSFGVIKFWARRIRRLLPAAILVLLVTLAGIVLFAPRSIWPIWIAEVGASAAYFENWLLAASSVDYLAADNSPSPTQHFWSLSVEEQFYFALPLLMLPIILLLKNPAKIRTAFLVMMSTLVLASFITAVVLSFTEPVSSYFFTQVRAWQFGAGALLAAAPLKAPSSNLVKNILAITGFAGIAFSSLYIQGSFDYPGFWALIPTIATLLVIYAQVSSGWLERITSLKPVQFLGDISYSLYLWHWPLIILLPLALAAELGTAQKVLIIALSLLLAFLSYRFIEQPFIKMGRAPKAKPRNAIALMLVGCGSILVATSAMASATSSAIQEELRALDSNTSFVAPCLGAAASEDGAVCPPPPSAENLRPPTELASQDNPSLFMPSSCQGTIATDSVPKPCALTPIQSDIKIALIGDSHAAQFVAPMTDLSNKNSWQVVSFSKGACPFSFGLRTSNTVPPEACRNWVAAALEIIKTQGFDLVITSQVSGVTWAAPDGKNQEDYAKDGLVSIWRELNESNIPVLAIQDNPRPIKAVVQCIERNDGTDYSACANKRAAALLFDPQRIAVEKLNSPKTRIADFTNTYCDSKICKAVIGGVIVNRDENHLTNTFARTLAPYLEKEIRDLLALSGR
jgi:peptidoglycan/LPS O-acetylase OafA/YrhL